MKLIYSTLILLITTPILAEEVPANLKDATIVVNLKDGSKANFSANDWKVVPRIDKPKAIKIEEKNSDLNNRLAISGGVGPQGYHSKQSSSEVNISNRNKDVFGLSYQRKITRRLSLGAQAITNGTYLLDLGLDF